MISSVNAEKTASQDAPGSAIANQAGINVHPNPGPGARPCPNCGSYQFHRQAGWTDDNHAYIRWLCCHFTQRFESWPS